MIIKTQGIKAVPEVLGLTNIPVSFISLLSHLCRLPPCFSSFPVFLDILKPSMCPYDASRPYGGFFEGRVFSRRRSNALFFGLGVLYLLALATRTGMQHDLVCKSTSAWEGPSPKAKPKEGQDL